jgi:enamine deaminase RidA (YjgF/YER057c/UK114 family)
MEAQGPVSFAGKDALGNPLVARAGNLVFSGGGFAVTETGEVPADVLPLDGYPNHWSRVNRELMHVYGRLDAALAEVGTDLSQTLRINSFHTDSADVYEALRMRPEVFGDEPPASTLVLVPELPVHGGRVALDTIAVVPGGEFPRDALVTSTPGAPMPPHERIWGRRIYSKSVRGGGFIFTSGRTNNVIGGDADATARGLLNMPHAQDRAETTTRMILAYLMESLASFGAGPHDVVKAEIHLSDLNQIAAVERVWCEVFPTDPPARTFVKTMFPTTYTTLEIEFIAIDPRAALPRRQIGAIGQAPALGHEPIAVQAGPYVFFSGLCAQDGINGLAAGARVDPSYPYHDSQSRREVAWIATAIEDALGGIQIEPLRMRAFGPSLGFLPHLGAIWRDRFGRMPPVTTCGLGADCLPVPDTSLMIDLMAWNGDNFGGRAGSVAQIG